MNNLMLSKGLTTKNSICSETEVNDSFLYSFIAKQYWPGLVDLARLCQSMFRLVFKKSLNIMKSGTFYSEVRISKLNNFPLVLCTRISYKNLF